MAKKRSKKGQRKSAKKQQRNKATIPASPARTPVMSAQPESRPTATTVKPKRLARFSRAEASHAARRGADLVRYLRIHARTPYGKRGEEAIGRLAVEVGHLGNLEIALRDERDDDGARHSHEAGSGDTQASAARPKWGSF